MNRKRFISVLCSLIFPAFVFVSCSTSYESMLKEYNSCFGQETGTKAPLTIDEIKQTDMIAYAEYDIYFDYIFSLTAPEGGLKYTWTICNDKYNGTPVFTQTEDRVLQFKPSKENLEAGNYYLTLVVETEKSTYSDETKLKLDKHP